MVRISQVIFMSLVIILALLFYNYSEIDLIVSGWFYNSNKGGFYLKDAWFAQILYKTVFLITILFIISFVFLGIRKILNSRKGIPANYMNLIYVMLVCIIGPGLLVHSVFKDQFGRARPNSVEAFGGQSKFTPAFVISDQCIKNCSFVSGHASIGFVFFAFAFLNRGKKRLYYNLLAISLGTLFGAGRIIQGAHFLSDVVFSGVVVYITAYLLSKLILESSHFRKLINGITKYN